MPIISWYEYSHTRTRIFLSLSFDNSTYAHYSVSIQSTSHWENCRIRNMPKVPLQTNASTEMAHADCWYIDMLCVFIYLFIYVICTLCTVLHWTVGIVELTPIICRLVKQYSYLENITKTFVCLFVRSFLGFLKVPCVANFWLLFYMKMV